MTHALASSLSCTIMLLYIVIKRQNHPWIVGPMMYISNKSLELTAVLTSKSVKMEMTQFFNSHKLWASSFTVSARTGKY